MMEKDDFLEKEFDFKPAIIFWIIKEKEVHVRRVTREAYHWKHFYATHKNYEYRYSALDLENDKRHLDEEHLKREDHTRSRCRRSEQYRPSTRDLLFAQILVA